VTWCGWRELGGHGKRVNAQLKTWRMLWKRAGWDDIFFMIRRIRKLPAYGDIAGSHEAV
jgi:hypothetical protein